ncbi:hypothetical protein BG006_002889, partial [Podila minutissima]
NNTKSRESAAAILSKPNEPTDQGYVTVVPQDVPGGIHPGSVDHHVIGSFKAWFPIEGFARTFSWFTQPYQAHCPRSSLTKKHLLDHTDRAIWMGQSLPLAIAIFRKDVLDESPLEHPECGFGYISKNVTVA